MTVGPAQNRVTPFGDIEAIALRGAFTGNRGNLHTGRQDEVPDGRRILRPYAHNSWVTCALTFHDRWNEQWLPRRLTWLYFYDEAVSLAAGHRPCAECRRSSYERYREAWGAALGGALPSGYEMNRQLQQERVVPRVRRRRLHDLAWADLPVGTFVVVDASPWLVAEDGALIEWTNTGYAERRRRPTVGTAPVITPPSSVAVLRAGYGIQIDPTAR